jgi:hypothetical protein
MHDTLPRLLDSERLSGFAHTAHSGCVRSFLGGFKLFHGAE